MEKIYSNDGNIINNIKHKYLIIYNTYRRWFKVQNQ